MELPGAIMPILCINVLSRIIEINSLGDTRLKREPHCPARKRRIAFAEILILNACLLKFAYDFATL
jgi:hypothetical protein